MSYFPQTEAELVTFSTTFAGVISADPAACGLTLAQATDYTAAQEAFGAAYQASKNPSTRSPATIEQKRTLKAALVALTRSYVKICQAYPGMTNDLRVQLGITVPDVTPTPSPIPEEPPVLDVVSVSGHTIKLRLHNGDPSRRARPAGVTGATLFSYVGEQPPVDLGAWKFEGNTTKLRETLVLPGTVAAGSVVWLTAFWFNARAQSGPACTPVSTHVGFGGVSQVA